MTAATRSDGVRHAYQLVADDMLDRIRRGEWRQGDQIPAVRSLEGIYPHSRVTLHRAVQHLTERGYLECMRGRGTFVRTTHIRDRVAILAGGLVSAHERSPLTHASVDCACAYFQRCGMDPRVYSEDPLSATRLPAALVEDLEADKLKGLLTVQSSFAYRHMRTGHWERYRVPHVEIGSVSAPHRVYVDFNAFFERALTLARARGCRRPMLAAHGRMIDPNDLRRRFSGEGVSFLTPPADVPSDIGHEEWGYRVMRDFWRCASDVDALIVSDDSVAKGIAQAALACAVDVPGRVQIVALTNRGLSVFFPVPIVRFEVYVEAMVVAAGDLLLRLIVTPDLPPETILLPPEPADGAMGEAWA